MLRAIGVFIAWLAAFVQEDPSPRECFCNCTCSIEHRIAENHSSWLWELTKGLIFCGVGSILTVCWRVILRLAVYLVEVITSWWLNHLTETIKPLESPSSEGEAGAIRESPSELTVRAQEQLATLRHRQALRQTHGSR